MMAMQNLLPKKILETSDVKTITPVRSKLSLIPEHIAKQYEIVPFDGDGMMLAVITTNTFSEELKTIYAGLQKAGYTTDVYYTDKEGIGIALGWYTTVSAQVSQEQQKIKEQQEAVGKNAIAQIMEMYPKRSAMDP